MANDAATATVSPVVETVSGKLRGLAAGGIFAFKGVPYGADTGGANRFMPPFPPPPWTGVREAFAYRGQAPQAPSTKLQVALKLRSTCMPHPRCQHSI